MADEKQKRSQNRSPQVRAVLVRKSDGKELGVLQSGDQYLPVLIAQKFGNKVDFREHQASKAIGRTEVEDGTLEQLLNS